MATEPLVGRRHTEVTERRTKTDWARFLRDIAAEYPGATRITLVMDNLNTHRPGALYEAFEPAEATALWDRFEFVYTPKHGSWLNVAEVELNVLIRQCLNRRHRLHRPPARRDRRLAGGQRPDPKQGRLAVHDGPRTGQAQASLSDV